MKQILWSILALSFAVGACKPDGNRHYPVPTGVEEVAHWHYETSISDEFEGSTLDSSKWYIPKQLTLIVRHSRPGGGYPRKKIREENSRLNIFAIGVILIPEIRFL